MLRTNHTPTPSLNPSLPPIPSPSPSPSLNPNHNPNPNLTLTLTLTPCVPLSLNVYPLKVASTPALDLLQVPCFYVISPSFREDSDYAKYIWTATGVVLTPRTV